MLTFIPIFPNDAHTHGDSQPQLIIKIDKLFFLWMINGLMLDDIHEDFFSGSLVQ